MNEPADCQSAERAPWQGEIAIVGMACMFPGAPDLHTYWRNILTGVDAVTDVPPGRWDEVPFYDPTSDDDDRISSKRGGYLPTEIPFDPLAYGIMPLAVSGGEVDQFLVLKLVHDALADAGYTSGLPHGDRTEFVLGRGNYLGPGNSNLFQRSIGIEQALRVLKALHPEHTDEELEAIRHDLRASLPNFGPELGPTHIPNVVTGRAANRLDLMGRNYTVDAACASSLIAVETAMEDLLSGKCDLAIAGGSHTFTCVPLLMVFNTLHALSRRSEIRPFDEGADGTLPGEGIGILVLKRRADAERDGDRVYAVIKGVGSASDGRALSVMAPRVEGEILALRRAYERAGVDPRSVGLVEAHGTATLVGDMTEVQALKAVFGPRRGETATTGLGTVKSMIGHAMPASGVAGMIKAALALYHKVLPPTLHCDTPSAKLGLDESPFYINTATRPWMHGDSASSRRAGVNAFGFGGINAHVVLEEAGGGRDDAPDVLPWDSELVLLGAPTRDALVDEIARLQGYLAARPEVEMADLAYTLGCHFDAPRSRLAIIASSRDDLDKKLARARTKLSDPACAQLKDPRGIYYFAHPLAASGEAAKVAFLFPGEGSQRIDMLADLCLHFPEVRAIFDAADRAILSQGRSDPISADIFPSPCLRPEEREQAQERLWRIDRQCEAIMAANRAMFSLLSLLGITPDMMAGHSIGEWSSLTAGGIAEVEPPVEVLRSLDAMAKAIDADPAIPEATLLAVAADRTTAEHAIADVPDAFVALDNCPHQVVLAIGQAGLDTVTARLRERGIGFERSRFNRGSHTPLFAAFCDLARRHFAAVTITPPAVDVYSCLTAAPFPHDPEEIRRLLVRSWEQPVEYRRTVEAMYEAGARVFIEVGPGGVLSAFTDDILRRRGAHVLAVDVPKWTQLTGLNHLVALLTAQGFNLNITYLYKRRPLRALTLDAERDAPAAPSAQAQVMLNLSIPMMAPSKTLRDSLHRSRPVSPDGGEGTGSDERHAIAAGPDLDYPIESPSARSDTAAPSTVSVGTVALTGDNAGLPRPIEIATPVGAGARPLPPLAASSMVLRPALDLAPLPTTSTNGHGAAALTSFAPTSGSVMAHYMQMMQHFLQAEQRMVEGAVRAAPHAGVRRGMVDRPAQAMIPARPAGPDTYTGPLPLVGQILSLVPGQSLLARRYFTPNEDLYLHDHTFGGPMSTMDPTLEPLGVAPLTVSLEMMAEAAAQVLPDLVLTGIADVRAHRWLQVDDNASTVLEIAARRLDVSTGHVRVEVREVEADGTGVAGPLVIEGTVIFATGYEAPPPPEPLTVSNPRRTVKTAREMYAEKWMFHGPVFQGVAALDVSGDDGIIGTLEVLPTNGLFRSTDHPRLLTDVALLDAAGQLLGYWAKERLARSFVVFPIRVSALHVYAPNLPVGTRVRCHVRITEIMDQTVKVDMDIFGVDGHIWMRVCGWQDWRFHIVGDVYDFWRFPLSTVMSKPFPAALPPTHGASPAGEPGGRAMGGLGIGALTCYRMDTLKELGQTMVTKCLAYMALNHSERRVYHSLRGPTLRQVEWLAGRIAGKDAVRVYLQRTFGLSVGPGDIEIAADSYGRPQVSGPWIRQIGTAPALSLAHTDGVAIAIAGHVPGELGVGIDLERVGPRTAEFDATAFADEELALVGPGQGSARDERRLRLWCAKEAVAKALGHGLVEGPRSIRVTAWDEATGIVQVQVRGALGSAFAHLADKHIVAYTIRDGDYIVATSFGEAA